MLDVAFRTQKGDAIIHNLWTSVVVAKNKNWEVRAYTKDTKEFMGEIAQGFIILGVYFTEERAVEVLEDIISALNRGAKCYRVPAL